MPSQSVPAAWTLRAKGPAEAEVLGDARGARFAAAGLAAAAVGLAARRSSGGRRATPRLPCVAHCATAVAAQKSAMDSATEAAAALAVVPEGADPLSYIERPPEDLRERRLKARDSIKNSGAQTWPAPKNDRLLRAARGESVDRPPKWMMRQAGRYLPEYNALLKHTDFFSVCESPALAAEITLQPYRRYGNLDSLIIFSDILVIPVAMGLPCKMEPSVGPRFDWRLSEPKDMERLNLTPDVDQTLGYVFDAIFWTRQRVGNEVPVIGFSGAPWTLMGYMVEGGASRNFDRAKRWLYLYPDASRRLLSALRDIIVEYLVAQFDAGAPLLQVFDTNCGELPPRIFEEFCVPDLEHIAAEIKRRRPGALVSIFPKDGEIESFANGNYDVVGVSWTTSPEVARRSCPGKTLQGNFDPYGLYASPPEVRALAHRMVEEFGVQRYIANLGHGMLPTHPVEGPKAFLDAVDEAAGIIEKGSAALREVYDSAAFARVGTDGKPPAELHTSSAEGGAANAITEDASPNRAPFVMHMQEETAVTVPLSRESAAELREAITAFVARFKKKMADKKPGKLEDFEFECEQPGGLRVEVFCNPNAFANVFDVKLFMTVQKGTDLKVTSETPLSGLTSELDAFLG